MDFIHFFKKTRQYFQIVAYLFKKDKWSLLKKTEILLVRHDADCGFEFERKKYSQLLDSLQDELMQRDMHSISIASPYSVFSGSQTYSNAINFNGAFARAALFSKLENILLKFLLREKPIVNECRVSVWTFILTACQAKIVLAIQPDASLCKACHQLGVWVADVQHGVIAKENPWYGESFRKNSPKETLPDAFFCWDNRSVDVISNWTAKKNIAAYVIGNPWFIRFQNKNPYDRLVQSFSNEINKYLNERPTILVSLQWGFKKQKNDLICSYILPKALKKVISQTSNLYNWVIRLHPVQLERVEKKRIYRYIKNNFNREILNHCIELSKFPLPLILPVIDLHITYHSAVTIEAAWFGVPTALLNPELGKNRSYENIFIKERKHGIASLVPCDKHAIENWIAKTLITPTKFEVTKIDSSAYYHILDSFPAIIAQAYRNSPSINFDK